MAEYDNTKQSEMHALHFDKLLQEARTKVEKEFEEASIKKSRIESEAVDLRKNAEKEAESLLARAREIRTNVDNERAEILRMAQVDSDNLINDARGVESDIRKRIKALEKEELSLKERAHEERAQLVKDAKDKADQILDKAKKEKSETLANVDTLIADANKEGSRILSEAYAARDNIDSEIKSIKDNATKDTLQALAEAKEAKRIAEIERDKLLDDAHRTSDTVTKEADDYAIDVKNSADAYVKQTKLDASSYSEEVQQVADKTVAKILDDAKYRAENIVKVSQEEHAARLQKLDTDYLKKQQEFEQMYERKVHEKEKDCEDKFMVIEAEFKSKKDILIKEVEEQERYMNQDLATKRVKEVERDKERREAEDKKAKARRKFEIEEITRNVGVLLKSNIPVLAKVDRTQEQEEAFINDIKKKVRAVFAGEASGYADELKNMASYDPANSKRIRVYWIKRISIVTILLMLLGVFISNPNIIDDLGKRFIKHAEEQTSAEEIYLNNLKKQREDDIYRPEKTEKYSKEYKETYTDNVIYTEGYLEVVQSLDYQNKWTIEVRNFLIKLELNEDKVLKILPIEGNLVKDLVELKEQLKYSRLAPGIGKMKALEEDAMETLRKLFDAEIEFKSFLKHKKIFYQRYLEQRKVDQKFKSQI